MKKIIAFAFLAALIGCTTAPTPAPIETPMLATPQQKAITCNGDDVVCIINNVVGNFKNDCQPVEVIATVGDGSKEQVTFIISSGENGACHFQMKGLGADQDCLFNKENVNEQVIKGMLGMDNIPNDPEFQKIKAASCK